MFGLDGYPTVTHILERLLEYILARKEPHNLIQPNPNQIPEYDKIKLKARSNWKQEQRQGCRDPVYSIIERRGIWDRRNPLISMGSVVLIEVAMRKLCCDHVSVPFG